MEDFFENSSGLEDNVIGVVKDYYVYELFDRDTGEVFYVGEGVRDRAFQHVKEAERIRQKILSNPDFDGTLASEKIIRIQELLVEGRDRLGVRVVGRFDSKDAAQAVEAVLINWVYGASALTNISRGRGANYVRPKNLPTEELAGIDVARKLKIFSSGKNIQNTGYLKKKIDNHERYGHVAMAEEITEYLRERFPNLQIDEPCFWESGRYVAVFVTLIPGCVRLVIQLTDSGKNHHVYNLKPVSEATKDVSKFVEFMKENHIGVELKNNGRYCKLPSWSALAVKNESLDEIVEQVRYAEAYLVHPDKPQIPTKFV